TNNSKLDGDEVPQLYIKDEYSLVTTYEWQLRGFERIHLKAGETKKISFKVKPEHLTLLNREMQEVTEPGTFQLAIGSSSTDIRLKDTFEIKKN
ncbi:MAG: fibronectin type III-like domain-contianing protein, partial [Chlorobiales bacterium]|nr:fibronectin type III-like domain-contianing protein [Chlorobiales bacterium]